MTILLAEHRDCTSGEFLLTGCCGPRRSIVTSRKRKLREIYSLSYSDPSPRAAAGNTTAPPPPNAEAAFLEANNILRSVPLRLTRT